MTVYVKKKMSIQKVQNKGFGIHITGVSASIDYAFKESYRNSPLYVI